MADLQEESAQIRAIDVHGHYGAYRRDDASELDCAFMSGEPAAAVARARRAGIEVTFVSPLAGLLPRGRGEPVAANEEAARVVAATPGLWQWVIVHPGQPETFAQARRLVGMPRCAGLKIHPEEHRYPITEHGAALLSLAAELGAVVLAHSGEALSLPEDYVPLADQFPQVRLILAHLGNGARPDLQVRAIRAARHGNLYADTSSARSLTPGLIEWAVAQVGAERLLFGTDTPLYFAASQRARIDQAELTLAQRRHILRDNAVALFGLPTPDPGA
ncbi:MAG: amidohydrolase family protein [Candidatus Latescibacterota bacterium]